MIAGRWRRWKGLSPPPSLPPVKRWWNLIVVARFVFEVIKAMAFSKVWKAGQKCSAWEEGVCLEGMGNFCKKWQFNFNFYLTIHWWWAVWTALQICVLRRRLASNFHLILGLWFWKGVRKSSLKLIWLWRLNVLWTFSIEFFYILEFNVDVSVRWKYIQINFHISNFN